MAISKLQLQNQLSVTPSKLEAAIRDAGMNSGVQSFTQEQAETIAQVLQGKTTKPAHGKPSNSAIAPPPSVDAGQMLSLDATVLKTATQQGKALARREMTVVAESYAAEKQRLSGLLASHICAANQPYTEAVTVAVEDEGYSDPFAGYFIPASPELRQLVGS